MVCSIGGVGGTHVEGGVTAGCSTPGDGDMATVGAAGESLALVKALGGGGTNVGTVAGVFTAVPKVLGSDGAGSVDGKPKKPAGGGEKTGGGVGVLKRLGGVEGGRDFGGGVNIGKGGVIGALTLLPKRPGGVFGREDESVSTSCFTHVPNCGLGEAGCGTIVGGADLVAGGRKMGASVSPVRGAFARGELLTGRVPILGVKANGDVAGGFERD